MIEGRGWGQRLKTINYDSGYYKALMDLHSLFSKFEPAFRADRKRNNIKNAVWLLECILDNPDIFAAFGTETPIYHKQDGKNVIYYIKKDEWPISRKGGSPA